MVKMIKAQTGVLVSDNNLYRVESRPARRGIRTTLHDAKSGLIASIFRGRGYSVHADISQFPKYVQEAAMRLAGAGA